MKLTFELNFKMEEGNPKKAEKLEKNLLELKKVIDEPFRKDAEVRLDFSNTRWFSVSALLVLLVAVKALVNKKMNVKIRLPESRLEEKGKGAKMARDFLKRWGFFDALRYYFEDDKYFLMLIN